MFRWISGLLDRMCAVAGALLFSQFPLFIQQYIQQLSGHAAELGIQVKAIQGAATHSGKTLEQFIHKFIESQDTDFVRQGEIMQAMADRWHQFSTALSSLQGSSLIGRPFAFMSHFSLDIAQSTWKQFAFGLPFTTEGLAYAIIGVIFGFGFYYCVRKLLLGIFYSIKGLFRKES